MNIINLIDFIAILKWVVVILCNRRKLKIIDGAKLNQNKVCQVDYVHLEANLGYIYSYKNLQVGFQMNIINLTYFTNICSYFQAFQPVSIVYLPIILPSSPYLIFPRRSIKLKSFMKIPLTFLVFIISRISSWVNVLILLSVTSVQAPYRYISTSFINFGSFAVFFLLPENIEE